MTIKAYDQEKEITVNMLSLTEVIESLEAVDLVKMDCEGCEFPAILFTSDTVLSRVREWVIEYHDYPRPIVRKLEYAQFEVKVYKPYLVREGKPIGFLYAKRKW